MRLSSGRNFRLFLLAFATLLGLGLTLDARALARPHLGKWAILDKKTGQPSIIVETFLSSGKLCGKVVDCQTKNPKAKAYLGTVILQDLSPNGDEWVGGTLRHPIKEKSYQCNLKVIDQGEKLQIRAFLGTPALGQTLTWPRVN